ncbi:hypothetical protein [Bacillus sp. Au-Bac7]|uniref:hypothetical protein n=1 Tax=Bacillus sp. Au-Bac7 TaxID=2906458 RepID=UPI001E5CB4C4|nr:hypothetical protein [Bacillus sp. Au-Bac7]MCE4052067.1 hypothetical protein [Bacillus sp. Au-Bac7]
MSFLHWYDWIQPTNPYASFFFGIIFTIIIGITVWINTRKKTMAGFAVLAGISFSAIFVYILVLTGFYS